MAYAQNNVGVLYDNGQGVEQDDKEAVRWYRKAAAQHDASGQNNLGGMYLSGKGVPKDPKKATWMRADFAYNKGRRLLGEDNYRAALAEFERNLIRERK